ncbi:hypothetical protein [Nocardia sp. CA-135398]|uniref:hypothetical protein n=1 Tax=Nocardia sp. CA-135398 TaxID=3239977 RepID=UPI003D972E69
MYEPQMWPTSRPDRINEIPLFESHLIDINCGYDRLVSIARRQTDAWLAGH